MYAWRSIARGSNAHDTTAARAVEATYMPNRLEMYWEANVLLNMKMTRRNRSHFNRGKRLQAHFERSQNCFNYYALQVILMTAACVPNCRFLYSVPLQIGKMSTDKDVTQVERALLAVNGVVSITVELSTKEVMVYTRTQVRIHTIRSQFSASLTHP